VALDERQRSSPSSSTDIPLQASKERQALSKDIHTRALGLERAANARNVQTWGMLGGLASHDLSAMRELVGRPPGVELCKRLES
jgi:hypothetical protein